MAMEKRARKKATGVGGGKSSNQILIRYWTMVRKHAEKNLKMTLVTLLAGAYAFVTGVGKLVVISYLGRVRALPLDADATQYSNQFFVIGLTVCFLLVSLVLYFGYPGAITSMFAEDNQTLQSLLFPKSKSTAARKFRKKIFLLFAPLAAAVMALNFHLWAQITPSLAWNLNRAEQLAVIFAGISICLSCCSAFEVYAVRRSLKDIGAYIACFVASFIFFMIPALLLYILVLGRDESVNLLEMLAAQLLVLFLNMGAHRSLSTAGQIADCIKAGAGSLVLVFFMLGLWHVLPKGVVRLYGIGNVRGVTLGVNRQGREVLNAAGVPVQCDRGGDSCTARGLDLLLKTRSVYYLSYTTDDGRVIRFEMPVSDGIAVMSTDGGGVETAGPEVGKR
jgi:hypothetical protein